jgi:hypothetical protein
LGKGNFLGRLWGGYRGVGSSSDTDEPESNKSSACVEAQVAPLPPVEVEHKFLPTILMVAAVAFSITVSPDDFTTNLFMCFTGLARASSCAEV